MTTTMTDLATGKTFVFNDALPGRDAYEEALAEGFTGTRTEWLASLKGDTGVQGPAGPHGNTGPQGASVTGTLATIVGIAP